MDARERIVVGGSIAQKPGFAGHAWAFLQYLLGFERLGLDVLFVDWIPSEDAEASAKARWLEETLAAVGLGESYALLDGGTEEEVFGAEAPPPPEVPIPPAAGERAGRDTPRPLPRPGLAGGTAE